jgi:3-phenylpropionate/trans-cinnamate dioxygenase ferredoxin reductase component
MSTTVSAARQNVVIVGAGLAGFHLASALAKQGYPGDVTLVGEEPWQPYDRPPLSKQFQLDADESRIWLAPELGPAVRLLRQCQAQAIDLARQELRLDNGGTLPWDRLVLATGSRARRLPQWGASPRVLTLRTLDDARKIREALQSVASLLVIGGGPIGLELAASAAALGRQCTVVELAPRLMSRSAPAAMAVVLLEHHRSQGMAIHLGRTVVALDEGSAEAVLDDGQRVPAGLVVVGIGVQANDALAAQAGIACDDGVFVDGWCRTTAPGVFAVGDVTRQRNPVTGRFERIETWSNAQAQAQALAANWCHPAEARPYDAVPWFWSDQGSARLQCAGAITGEQQAWRVDAAGGRVLVHWSGGRVTGVATLNAARDFVQLKKLIVPRPTITPEQFSAPTANIRALVQHALAAGEK